MSDPAKGTALESRSGRATLPAMKVALFHPEFNAPRGAENLVLTFAEALQREKQEVRLVAFGWDEQRMGSRLAPFNPRPVPAPRIAWNGAPDAQTLTALREALAGCDLAMASNHPSNAYLGLCGGSARTLWYCHEPHRSLFAREANPAMTAALAAGRLEQEGTLAKAIAGALRRSRWKRLLSPRHRGRIALDRAGVARLDAVWANSAATARAVESIYGRAAEVFYPAVELVTELPPPAVWERPLRVLVMGGLGAYKGLQGLLQGMALFLRDHPGAAVLEIVGKGRELPDLKRIAASLGLGAAAQFHGFLPDPELAELKLRCHGFAAMPGDEPFGLVFAEAAGAGLVLIGPDHGGPREIMDDGRSGILADPFDSASIAKALARFSSLPQEQREGLRAAAFDSARARFAVADLGGRLVDRLDRLLTRA